MAQKESEDLIFDRKEKKLICPNITDYIRKSGVYKLIFDDSFFYIGASENLSQRMLSWATALSKTDHRAKSSYMRDNLPVGYTKMEVIILELCPPVNIFQREDFYICENFYDQYCLNAVCSLGRKNFTPNKKNKPELAIESKPLFISKTKWEWDVIMRKVASSGKKDLASFIRHEVWKLGTSYYNDGKPLHEEDGRKISKRPYIPIDSYSKLENIAEQMKIPVSSVVEKLIIQPLLQSSFL